MLTFTGHSMAVARGMPDANGQIVLCTGTGPVVVLVDENGQPMGTPHICPDYAASLIAALAEAPIMIGRDAGLVGLEWPAAERAALSRAQLTPFARGPPV